MEPADVHARVRAYVLEKLAPRGVKSVGDDESLTENGIVDSLGIFRLIAFLEATFALRIADEEITFANFGTIAAIERLVLAKAGQRAAER